MFEVFWTFQKHTLYSNFKRGILRRKKKFLPKVFFKHTNLDSILLLEAKLIVPKHVWDTKLDVLKNTPWVGIFSKFLRVLVKEILTLGGGVAKSKLHRTSANHQKNSKNFKTTKVKTSPCFAQSLQTLRL